MIVVVVMFKMEQELNCVKQLHTMHLVNLLTLTRGKGQVARDGEMIE